MFVLRASPRTFDNLHKIVRGCSCLFPFFLCILSDALDLPLCGKGGCVTHGGIIQK